MEIGEIMYYTSFHVDEGLMVAIGTTRFKTYQEAKDRAVKIVEEWNQKPQYVVTIERVA